MRRFITIFLALLSATSLFAQSGIRFRHLTVEDGLSQSMVKAIVQDRLGNIWLGTQSVLSCYDFSTSFKKYVGCLPTEYGKVKTDEKK